VVGLVAREAGIALEELRTAEDGLEEMFLALTADTQREADQPRTTIKTSAGSAA
jgi:ABC-2 type transport system ATP-binding protein